MSLLVQDPAEEMAMPDDVARQKDLAREIKERLSGMKSIRGPWEPLWQEVRALIRPNAEDFTGKTPNWSSRRQRVFDNYPALALQNLVSGIASTITNPAQRWFEFSTGNSAADQQFDLAAWLETCSNITYDNIYHPSAGFNLAANEVYADWGSFATAVIHFLDDEDRIVFRSVPLAECYIMENDKGIVDILYRAFEMSARACKMKFGDKLPESFDKEYKPEQNVKLIHAVYPIDSDVKFKSVYVLEKDDVVLEEGMFREFPYCVLRWTKMSGDVYGRGPGTDCLQDVRVLNEAVRLRLQRDQLVSAPPVIFENDGVLSKVNLQPWAQLMIAPGSQMPKILDVGDKASSNDEQIKALHDAIGKAFYNDIFATGDYGNRDRVTAEEVSTDQQNRLRQMTHIVGRLEVEFLDPLIKRVFAVLMKSGKLPPPPRAFQNKKLTIEYLSPAVQAMRGQKANSTLKFLQTIVPYLQFKPDILDSLNLDQVIKDAAFAMGVSRDAILPDQVVAQMRQQKAQAAQQQQQAEQATNATQGILNVAQANKASPGLLG